ncbi:SMODS domain-containing nucleotidyltransferase [Paraburkholderia bryophila]|uniref:Uncharacterized protein n=1 Tax=Paraburkholderia bryophila TaxID=420952 RepID=A0A7Z0B7K7_9BURK|nr:hypothetical protein [Paraburkholderia bryophila]NYH24229.1 hypothetical protein [Paraburkholderia bryophila]
MGVGEWFSDFCKSLRISSDKHSSVAYRTGRIVGRLNADLRGLDSKTAYRFYVGSYGRNTAIPLTYCTSCRTYSMNDFMDMSETGNRPC